VEASHVRGELDEILLTEDQIQTRVAQLAAELGTAYQGRVPVLVGVLNGAATFTVDLARAYAGQVELTWMAIRSYRTHNPASGSVRLLKDLDVDVTGRDVVIVDTVIDTGLTMNWLIAGLAQRSPASLAVCALLRKPDTPGFGGTTAYVGFDVGPGNIVGYGLDHHGLYRNLRCAATLAPRTYAVK
jgi:hypoxanthine phosphoribosyltransferase